MARARRSGTLIGLMFFDLDRFKQINDTLGHTTGDKVLKIVAVRLKEQLREADTISRLGGDEFTLILPQTGMDGAMVVAERMRAAVENHTFALAERGSITISLGVAVFPHHGTDSISLIRAADRVLYQAKRSGRNRVAACEAKAA